MQLYSNHFKFGIFPYRFFSLYMCVFLLYTYINSFVIFQYGFGGSGSDGDDDTRSTSCALYIPVSHHSY